MRILVASSSKNTLNGVKVINSTKMPLNISSDCVETLDFALSENEVRKMETYLDIVYVDVCLCNKQTELNLIGAYELPIETVAKLNGDTEDIYQYEMQIRNEYAHKIANLLFDEKIFLSLLSDFYAVVDTDKAKAKKLLKIIVSKNTIPSETVRAESYYEVF